MKNSANLLVHVKKGGDSGSSPGALSVKKFQPEKEKNEISEILHRFITENRDYSVFVKLILWLLYGTGARISEILTSKVIYDGYVISLYVRGAKGSRDRVKVVMSHSSLVLPVNIDLHYMIMDYSRFYIYRLCKKIGLQVSVKGNQRKAVTHSFRHTYVKRMRTVSENDQAMSREIGHKSNKSIHHYGHTED